jgi:NADH-quinone oxidoreductase subunit M
MTTLLLTMIVLPFATALAMVLLAPPLPSARWMALFGTAATWVTAVALAGSLFASRPASPTVGPIAPQAVYEAEWFRYEPAAGSEPVRVGLVLGIDRIGMVLALATALVAVTCVLASWSTTPARAPWYYAALLSIEGATLGQFASFDLVSFYVLFEFTLIPLFFLVAFWGDASGRAAATRAFVFLFTASVLLFAGLALLTVTVASQGLTTPCSIPAIANWLKDHPLDRTMEVTIFLLLAAGLLAKTPAFPLHTWLPATHAAAPTAANALFAGALLKPFGLLRLCLPLFPFACSEVGVTLVGGLSVAAVVYGALCALAQTDLKKLLAYSSVSHMGGCTLGMFALNIEGLTGAVLLMVAHGLATAGLFLLIGAIADRYSVRDLTAFGGLAQRMPTLATLLVLMTMVSIGLPGLAVFPGEFLAITGMFKTHWALAVGAATGVVLGAWYMLGMVSRLAFGPLKEPDVDRSMVLDLRAPESFAVVLLGTACVWLGVDPQPLAEAIRPDLDRIVALYEEPLAPVTARAETHPPVASLR